MLGTSDRSSPSVDSLDGVPALPPRIRGVLGDQGLEGVAHGVPFDVHDSDELSLRYARLPCQLSDYCLAGSCLIFIIIAWCGCEILD